MSPDFVGEELIAKAGAPTFGCNDCFDEARTANIMLKKTKLAFLPDRQILCQNIVREKWWKKIFKFKNACQLKLPQPGSGVQQSVRDAPPPWD